MSFLFVQWSIIFKYIFFQKQPLQELVNYKNQDRLPQNLEELKNVPNKKRIKMYQT